MINASNKYFGFVNMVERCATLPESGIILYTEEIDRNNTKNEETYVVGHKFINGTETISTQNASSGKTSGKMLCYATRNYATQYLKRLGLDKSNLIDNCDDERKFGNNEYTVFPYMVRIYWGDKKDTPLKPPKEVRTIVH